MSPAKNHASNDVPTEPAWSKTEPGEAKMPDPIIVPMMSETPPSKVSDLAIRSGDPSTPLHNDIGTRPK